MANRYWVGGTATWDATALLKWSTTSGGIGGSAVPTSADTVFFDANSGANTVTIGAGTAICSTLTMTGFTGTLAFGSNSIDLAGTGTITVYTGATTFSVTGTPLMLVTGNTASSRSIVTGATTEANSISFDISAGNGFISILVGNNLKNLIFSGTFTGTLGNSSRTIYGNLTLKSGMSLTAGTGTQTFAATSGTQTITSAALTLDFPININAPAATVQLVDALIMGSARQLTLVNGTFNSNAKNVTCGTFGYNFANTKTLTLTNSTVTIQGGSSTLGFVGSTTGTTYSSTGAEIIFTTSGTALLSGIGSTNTDLIATMSGTGQLIIGTASQSSVIKTLRNTVQPCTVSLLSTAGTLTVTNFNLSGTAGNLVTLNTTVAGTARTISKTSGTVNAYYLNIQDSTASGGAVWYANSSINGTNNTGWNVFNNSFLMVF
jgi:hypothetical protein